MMTVTHAFVGALLGLGAAALAPEIATPAILAGFVGGALPDADLVATHRRTTHFPVYAPFVAVPVVGAAVVTGSPPLVLAAVFALAAAVHCVTDVVGGGVEARPWEATSDQGVYDHYRGRWIRPRRWVRYSGAPEDFALALVAAVPTLAVTSGRLRDALVIVLAVSAVFTLFRRRLGAITERLLAHTLE